MQEPVNLVGGTARKEGDDVVLDCEWTIWHENRKSTGGLTELDYMKELSTVGSFQTLKEFWELWGTIPLEGATTVHVFKAGIKPIWEDPANQDGGKWVVTINQEHEDHQRVMKMWFSLVVAVFCGQLEYSDDMCGVVLAVRNWGTGLHVWNMHSGDTEKQEQVKQSLHKLLKTKKIKYIRHQTSILKNMNTSDSEGSKPRNWEKKRPHDYDSDYKSRAARSSPPTVQDGTTRPRRFSVGSESKPEPIRPNLAPPAKNPWNIPPKNSPMNPVPENAEPTPTPTPTPAPATVPTAAPTPIKNPWHIPPKTPAAAPPPPTDVPATTSSPELHATESHAPASTPAPAQTSAQAPTQPGTSLAPTNPWKVPPKKESAQPSSPPQPTQPAQSTQTQSPPLPQPTQQHTETQAQPQPQPHKKQQPHTTEANVHSGKQKPTEESIPTKSAPAPPKEKVVQAPQWDGKKLIKTLETAGETDFMPIDTPIKPDKAHKPPKNPRRHYTTDPSSGEEDNARRRGVPARAPPVQPLPSTVTTAPVFTAPAPAHAEPPAQSAAGGDSEWSVIADKPKRKPRTQESASDREGYARQRKTAQPQEYELLEGIQEEEEERAEREREERNARAQRAQPQQPSEGSESASQGEGSKAASGASGGENAGQVPSGAEQATPSKPAVRRRRELGVRHPKSHSTSAAQANAEAAATQVSNENLKVLIVAPMAMLGLLLLVYILFF